MILGIMELSRKKRPNQRKLLLKEVVDKLGDKASLIKSFLQNFQELIAVRMSLTSSCVILFNLLFIVSIRFLNANAEDLCKPFDVDDLSVSLKAIQVLTADINYNITNNINQYLAQLRGTLQYDELPPDTVKYYFFTPEKPKEPYNITATKGVFKTIPYDYKKPLAFGIHGFAQNVRFINGLTGKVIRSIVSLRKYNVIFVDYSSLNDNVFSVVVPRVYLAAKQMVRFLQFLMVETGLRKEDIHIYGISLGGQISSQVAKYLPGIGRITGLDPAGAFFRLFPKDLRLDRSDANFVDVIHTADAYPFPKGLGFYPPIGHLDFYPNGGKFQPGCGAKIPVEEVPTTQDEVDARICMHERLGVYFVESICPKCTFIGVRCESYEKFEEGLCTVYNRDTAILGEFAEKPLIDLPEDTMFFLDTNCHYPFCKQQQEKQNSFFENLLKPISNFIYKIL